MKKLVIAFSLVMMIAGGTVSVLKWLKIGPFEQVGGDVEEAAPPEPPRFVDMDPIVIPVFQGDKVALTMQMQIKLETHGDDNEAKIHKLMPRINDAFLKELYIFMPMHLKKNEKLDIDIVRGRLKRVGDKVTGKDTISNVLVQSVTDIPGR